MASAVLLGVVSCGPGEDVAFPTPAPSTSEPVQAPADGRHFGYIRTVDLDAGTLSIDLAAFLTGDAADRAAIAAGEIEPGDEVPNDYYIDNGEEEYVTIAVDEDVGIRVVGEPPDLVDGELEPFAEAFTKRPDEIEPDARYRGVTSQYWVTVRKRIVVAIEEQYLP